MPMIDETAFIKEFCPSHGSAVNPATELAEDCVVAWLWRIGMLTTRAQEEHLRSFKFGLYHGMVTPEIDHEYLVLGLMWFCWGSLADDQYDNYEGADRESRLLGVLRTMRKIVAGSAMAKDEVLCNPVIVGFAEFWPRLTEKMTPRARRRTAAHFMDYMQAIAFQNAFHAAHRIPDAATFLTLRRNTIAMIFQADILAVVASLHVPDDLYESFLYRELVACFADITAWHNDLYGLEKDIADGQTCNMVRVVALSEECTLEQAVERVVARAMQRQKLFVDLLAQLPALARQLDLAPEAAQHGAQLALYLRRYAYANLVWIKHTHRYDLDRPRICGTFDNLIARPSAVDPR